MNKRVQRYRERTEVPGSFPENLDLPLTIHAMIASRWGPGDGFSRTGRPDLSLSLITRGNAVFTQDGRRGPVARRQVFMAHKSASQSLQTGDEGFMHKRSMIISGSMLDAVVASLRLNEADVVTPRDYSASLRIFREADRCLQVKPPDMAKRLSVFAWRILMDCREGLALEYPAMLRRAIDYIVVNIHHDLTSEVIAERAGVSVRQCARLFRRHLGCSPMAFCARQRMTIAQNMVLHSNAPFKRIASAVGFGDPLYFSSRFRKYFGVSPSECRRRAREV